MYQILRHDDVVFVGLFWWGFYAGII